MRSAGGKGFGVQCREAMSGFGHRQSVLPVKLSRVRAVREDLAYSALSNVLDGEPDKTNVLPP